MAWISSHQQIEKHPKTLDLMEIMGWDLDQTIGKLHRFWWWCVDYAENGDLRKHNDTRLANAVGLNSDQAKRFVEAMKKARWLDVDPYFRVHDWWDHIGTFMQSRYKHYPEKWQGIRKLYVKGSKNSSKNRTDNIHKEENSKNIYIQPIPGDLEGDREWIEKWLAYKKEMGKSYKPTGLNALWGRLRGIPAGQRKAAIEHSMSNGWAGLFEPKEKPSGKAAGDYSAAKPSKYPD